MRLSAANRSRNVLELLLAEVLEGVIELVANVVADHSAYCDPTRLGQSLQACGHVYPIAEDVITFHNHIAQVDPDPELDPLIRRGVRIAIGHTPLDLDRTTNGIHDACKLCQEAVASVLDDPAAVLGDIGIDQLPEVPLQSLVRAFLVCPHKPRIPCDIRRKDRSETAGPGHIASPAAIRRPVKNSSRCSGFRYRMIVGITQGMIVRNRFTTSLASSSRPICA